MRGLGDFWGHMLVARGAAQVMIDPTVRTWDTTAVEVIVREAGGTITQLDGSPLADAQLLRLDVRRPAARRDRGDGGRDGAVKPATRAPRPV